MSSAGTKCLLLFRSRVRCGRGEKIPVRILRQRRPVFCHVHDVLSRRAGLVRKDGDRSRTRLGKTLAPESYPRSRPSAGSVAPVACPPGLRRHRADHRDVNRVGAGAFSPTASRPCTDRPAGPPCLPPFQRLVRRGPDRAWFRLAALSDHVVTGQALASATWRGCLGYVAVPRKKLPRFVAKRAFFVGEAKIHPGVFPVIPPRRGGAGR